MRKITILFMILLSFAGLTACSNTNTSGTSDKNEMTIQLEPDKNYDDTDPFVHEKLFCVTEDLDALIAEGTLELDGESVIIEIKNNKTKEILWSNTGEGNTNSETFSISLENLKKRR